jgi:hypothetical protein
MFTFRRFKPAIIASGAALTLALAGTGIAAAASSGSHAAHASAKRVTVSCTKTSLFAVVNKAGKLQRAGCSGISSKALSQPGHFQVLFPRNVRHCAYVASIGNAGSASSIPVPGYAGVVGRTGNTHGVFVETFDHNGVPFSIGFHVFVACR